MLAELTRLNHFAQGDDFALAVGNLDADRRFAGDAFDQNRFALERETKVLGKAQHLGVLDTRIGFEFKRRHDRAGVDLHDRATDFEFFELDLNAVRDFVQLFGVVRGAGVRRH